METHRGLLTGFKPRPPAAAALRIGGGGGGGRCSCRGSEDPCFGGLCIGVSVGKEVCFEMGVVEEGLVVPRETWLLVNDASKLRLN